MNGRDDFNEFGNIPDPNLGRAEVEENNNVNDAMSSDNDRDGGSSRKRHRHTAYQIQELETFYENNPRPTKDERSELEQRLNLEANQVISWFKNKRTQAKKNGEHDQNRDLIEDHARLLGPQEQLRNPMLRSSSNIWGMATNSPSESLPLSSSNPGINATPQLDLGCGTTSVRETSEFLNLANTAMQELKALGVKDCPFWTNDIRYEKYRGVFDCAGYVVETSRHVGVVPMKSSTLVKTLMDTDKWADVFASIAPVATTQKFIRAGYGGAKSGSLQEIQAEFQVISPLVPKRQVTFLRYCEKIRKGFWVVVDVSNRCPQAYGASNRLPSGLIIEDMDNGYSKATWIEQAEYNENHIHHLYRPLIESGIGLGAKRWLTTLQRYCEGLSTLSSTNLGEISPGLSAKGATELVKLAQRMTLSYNTGITGSTVGKWEIIQVENVAQNTRFMTRKNLNEPGEHTGIVLSGSTSVWFPVNQLSLFAFLSNRSFRYVWDVLSRGTSMEEKIRIEKAERHGNIISLLRIIGNGMLVLQEVWNDASGAVLVYAPVETSSIEPVKRGENSDSVQLLPSGFSIVPDGVTDGGCLLTLGLQILVSRNPTAELTQGFANKVENLMLHIIGKLKSALPIQT